MSGCVAKVLLAAAFTPKDEFGVEISADYSPLVNILFEWGRGHIHPAQAYF